MRRKTLYFTVLAIAFQSCGSAPPAIRTLSGQGGDHYVIPVTAKGNEYVITGKVRLDLPEYRVRGSCRIHYDGDAGVQVDFLHSSIFGSYREDATLYISEKDLVIYDHERDEVWDTGSSLDALERHFGFPIFSADIITLLLFSEPDIIDKSIGYDGDEWETAGRWRGREAVIKGKEGLGPVEISLCGIDGTPCCMVRYKYKEWDGAGWYPEKIVFEQEYGPARLSLSVSDIERTPAGEAGEYRERSKLSENYPEPFGEEGVSTDEGR